MSPVTFWIFSFSHKADQSDANTAVSCISSVLDSSMFSWTVGDSFHLHLHSQPHVQQIPVTPAGKRSGRSAFSSHEGGLKTDGLY